MKDELKPKPERNGFWSKLVRLVVRVVELIITKKGQS